MSDEIAWSARFWSKVIINGPDECWPWLASVSKKGHGLFQVERSNHPAHRVAYALIKGKIAAGRVVRHTCDQPDCVNPSHLILGTIADNAADFRSRGRPPRRSRLARRVPQRSGPAPGDLMNRFSASYIVQENGCWDWQLARIKRTGHGLITIGGKTKKAHRVAYELLVASIPDGLLVLHNCDNACCVNPAHLRVGTHLDNMEDMRVRRRAATGKNNHFGKVTYRGSQIKRAVLTEEAVRQIRASTNPYQLMKAFGVTKGAISHVLARRTWKHVE